MKKNKRLTVIVSVLLIGIGISLAYFLGKTLFLGDGADVSGSVAELNGATLEIKGTIEFNDNDKNMYPGHKTVSGIEAIATGDDEFIPYNIIWNGSNNFNTNLRYEVYKSSSSLEVSATCEDKTEVKDGAQQLSEECEINNIQGLEKVSSGEIAGNSSDINVEIVNGEFITATKNGNKVYYYVIIEYPDTGEDQSGEINGSFSGKIKGEISDAEADITISSIYIEENKKYKEVEQIPENIEEYILDTQESTCTNLSEPIWNEKERSLTVNKLSKTGTECNIYFKIKPTAEDTLAKWGLTDSLMEGDAKFTGTACGTCDITNENGIYKTEDNDGTSYYFRGSVSNNWVKFGTNDSGTPVWWRIVRINGDGTIRLIYAGTSSTAPSTTGTGTVVATGKAYNSAYSDNTYVGFYYGDTGGSYPSNHSNKNKSTIATELETWYKGTGWNAEKYENYIDPEAGFCNDRTIHPTNGTWWTSEGSSGRGSGRVVTAYGPFSRFLNSSNSWKNPQTPTLLCGKDPSKEGNEVKDDDYQRDLFTPKNAKKGNQALEVPVGLITADEVVFAGGFGGKNNTGYYLYNNQYFWTMSPYSMGANGSAIVFYVGGSGDLANTGVSWAGGGVRPVINLKADTEFRFQDGASATKGTSANPYIVGG